jgi:hypothetical protein
MEADVTHEPSAAGRDEADQRVKALRYDQRPIDDTPRHTGELPDTPTRDRNIPATAWVEAPPALLTLGDDLGHTDPQFRVAMYKRRIGRWLLWRAGPAAEADARYLAIDGDDLARHVSFRLFPDGAGEGEGPSGVVHRRFREWKQDLLAA